MLTPQQIQKNIEALEQQGAQPKEIQEYLNSLPKPQTAQPVTQEQTGGGFKGAVQDIAKSAVGSTLIRPAIRTGQAIGAGLVNTFGTDEQKERLGQELQKPVNFMGINVNPQKGFGEGGGKQIAGEGLEAASWLYGAGKAPNVLKNTLGGQIAAGSKLGAQIGGVSGGAYSSGMALQDDKPMGEVAKEGAIGAGIGTIAGAGLGAGLPLVPGAVRMGIDKGGPLTQKAVDTTVGAAKSIGNTLAGPVKRISSNIGHFIDNKTAQLKKLQNEPQHIKDAVRIGIDEPQINLIREGTEQDKSLFYKMYERMQEGKKSLMPSKQPKEMVGEGINQGPVKHLIETKNQSVKETRQVLDSLPQEPQDIVPIFDEFTYMMQQKGLTFDEAGNPILSRGSNITPEDVPLYKSIYEKLVPDDGSPITYNDMHGIRQFLFEKFNIASARQQPFSDSAVNTAETIRKRLADQISEASGGAYQQAQQKTAETMGALKEYAQIMGYKGNLEDITLKDLKSAEVFMRIFGNASDRPMSMLNQINEVAEKYGYQSSEDFIRQLKFADFLEDVFGTSQSGSMKGIVGGKVTEQGVEAKSLGLLREAFKWSPTAAGIRGARLLMGHHPKDVIRTFENMLRAEAGLPPLPKSANSGTGALESVKKNAKTFVDEAKERFTSKTGVKFPKADDFKNPIQKTDTSLPKTQSSIQKNLLKGIDTSNIELDVRPLSKSVLELSWIKAPTSGSQIIPQLEKNAIDQGFKTIQGSIKRDSSASKLKEIWSKHGYQIVDDPNMNTIIITKNL